MSKSATRLLTMGALFALTFSLTACGSSSPPESPTTTPPETTSDTSADAPTSASGEPVFANNMFTDVDFDIQIYDVKVIPAGQVGNEYGTAPVIAFWYEITNKKPVDTIDPTTSWMFTFEAVQDNDPNIVNKLSVGMLPDSAFLDTQLAQIKPGGTIKNAVAYELTDDATPVTLIASNLLGDEYGRQDYPIA